MILSKSNIWLYLFQKRNLSWEESIFRISEISGIKLRNLCFQVQLTNRTGFFLKQPKSQQAYDISTFEQEAIFYNWVKNESALDSLRPFLPHFWGYDSIHHIIILGLLENTISLAKYLKTKKLNLKLSENISSVFQKFNHVGFSVDISLPQILSLPFFDIENPHFQSELGRFDPLAQSLAERIAGNFVLLQGIKKASLLWQINGLLHGDIKFENWLINIQTKQLYLIDWEAAAFGDTDWDLACMLRSIILDDLFKEKVVLILGLTPLNSILNNARLLKNLKEFFKGYSCKFDTNQKEKIIVFLAVSILQKLIELAQAGSELGNRNTQLLGLSEDILQNPNPYFVIFNQ